MLLLPLVAVTAPVAASAAPGVPAAPPAPRPYLAGSVTAVQPDSRSQDAISRQAIPQVTTDRLRSRAETWLTAYQNGTKKVPYDTNSTFQGYRMDCSGYVSMALGLPGPGLDTGGLASSSVSHPISQNDLAFGDMLINPAPGADGHVVLFDYWLDAGHTRYVGYEEHGSGGTERHEIPYPYSGEYPMSPYQYNGLVKGSASETASKVRWADLNGDGRDDYVVVNDNGSVNAWINQGGDGHGGWLDYGQVATGITSYADRVRFADFNGDGRADYWVISPGGAVQVWLNEGGDGHGGWTALGQVATGTTSDFNRLRLADINSDGRADYLSINLNGSVDAWLNHGGDGHGGWEAYGQIATGLTSNSDQVRFADLSADGRAEYVVMNLNGSVDEWFNAGGDGHGGWQAYGQIATASSPSSRHRHLLLRNQGVPAAPFAGTPAHGLAMG